MPIIRTSYDPRLKVAHKSADQIVNNSTVAVYATELGVPVRASSTYRIEAVIRGSSNVLADWKFSIRGPAGSSGFFTLASQNTNIGPTTAIGSDTVGVNSIGGDEVIMLWGIMLTGAAAGEAQLWFAQSAAHASNTTIVQNSNISALLME